ncbi:MAG: sigma-70 family RNA polymerase sigma factor [Clostridia bacterium]|nr:sigma-70 family RNA polymerase sigma factor [Clostridia bacterium]
MSKTTPKAAFGDYGDEQLAAAVRADVPGAAEALFSRYLPTAKYLTSGISGASIEQDDLVQEAMLALFSSVYAYTPDKKAAFRTFATVCMKNRLRTVLKAQQTQKNVPLHAYVSLEDVDPTDPAEDPETLLISNENAEYLFRVINTELSRREREVLRLFLCGLSYAEIAAKLGINEKSASNALQRMRAKLKKAMANSSS